MTAIIAEPGDHLMVLNGICIGVHTGTIHQPPVKAKAPRTAEPMAPRRAKHKNKRKGRKTTRPFIERADPATMATRLAKFAALITEKPRTTGELLQLMGLKNRSQVMTIANHLDREGKLAKPRKNGTGHRRVYELIKEAS